MTPTPLSPGSVDADRAITTPFRPVELTGRGTTFACDLAGPTADAPVVMLLHGLFATGSLNWSPFFDALTDDFRVVVVDHRGHGHGIVGDDGFTLDECADDAAALLRTLDIHEAIVAGYSMGGPIAQLVWRRHPELVRGLVLCATAGEFAITPVDDLLLPIVDGAGRMLSMLPSSVRSRLTEPALALLGPDRERRVEVAAALSRHDLPSIRAAIRSIARFSSVDWLTDIAVPTTVVVTDRDRVVAPARQLQLADLIPDAQVIRVDGDHFVCFGDEDTFGEALLAACRSVARRAGLRVPGSRPGGRLIGRLRARWRRWRARRRGRR